MSPQKGTSFTPADEAADQAFVAFLLQPKGRTVLRSCGYVLRQPVAGPGARRDRLAQALPRADSQAVQVSGRYSRKLIVQVGRHAVGRIPGTAAILTSAVVWVVLLGPLVVLLTQVSPHSIRVNLDQPGPSTRFGPPSKRAPSRSDAWWCWARPLAYLLARGRLRFARVVEAGIILPLLMPPLVIGLLLIFLIGQAGPVGRVVSSIDPNVFGVNTFFALVVAEFYEAAPYYIITATAALATVDERLEQDAQLLGDRPLSTFRRITLPLAAPGLATGLAIAWARAMGAFGAVLIVAYNPAGLPIDDRSDLHRQWPRPGPRLCPPAHRGRPAAAADRFSLERPCPRTQRRSPSPVTVSL